MTTRSTFGLLASVIALTLTALACGDAEQPARPSAPLEQNSAATSADGTASLSASTYYCFGSYRRLSFTSYSYATNQQFGGALTSGTNTAMLAQCRDRIKVDPTWTAHVCDGLASGINWTVNTDHCVKTCATCGIGQSCSAFSSSCFNGVVTP